MHNPPLTLFPPQFCLGESWTYWWDWKSYLCEERYWQKGSSSEKFQWCQEVSRPHEMQCDRIGFTSTTETIAENNLWSYFYLRRSLLLLPKSQYCKNWTQGYSRADSMSAEANIGNAILLHPQALCCWSYSLFQFRRMWDPPSECCIAFQHWTLSTDCVKHAANLYHMWVLSLPD